ncbi:hypothetical protein ACLB2K_043913 [Fragaria x ananassa]
MALSITSRQSHDNNNSMSEVLTSIDILTLVAQCLANHDDLLDLIHFAQVCKTWHQAAAILPRLQRPRMPWLFSFDRSAGRFGLCDFSSTKQNCSHELKISPKLRKFITGSHDDDLYVCTSKHGKNNRLHTCNPRSRNKKWTSHLVSHKFWPSTYMNGTLYSLSLNWYRTELMGMSGMANQDSGVVTRVYSSSSLEETQEWTDFNVLFESNGELLLAIRYFKSYESGFYWRVYQFDPLREDGRNHWASIESLGNRTLAIRTCSCDFRRDMVVVVHEAKEFADMIVHDNTTYIRETDDQGSIWRKEKDNEWNFMRPSVTYIEPFLFAS